MSSKTINLFLLRHGLPEGDNCLRGSTDFTITEQGLVQMHAAIANRHFCRVVSSPLKRCCVFARRFANERSLPLILDDAFAEMDFGDWDGQPFDALFNAENNQVMAFFDSPYQVSPPNGESMHHFNGRVQAGFNRLCHHCINEQSDENVLVVTHAGVMREILHLVLGMDKGNGTLHRLVNLEYASLLHISVYQYQQRLYFQVKL